VSEPVTTTVDLVIRIQVVGDKQDVANCRGALECLAEVMTVQAEDGLWSLGHEEAENDDGPSVPVADITSTRVHAVLSDGSKRADEGAQLMSTAFVPKHFPRTRLTSGRVLSDSQQYQYDVLRTVGGKLVAAELTQLASDHQRSLS
jgi:hypothetical protein